MTSIVSVHLVTMETDVRLTETTVLLILAKTETVM